ncbi:unnamed protein product [Adineta steineri]|uniref:Reverse transcriptase RNase H-like domain-containing protein n=1 Tax=Adineta steineri TaxID=433720 RepID=A0A819W408_9BILA|nr:unnamed protein product [Adineta steineri]
MMVHVKYNRQTIRLRIVFVCGYGNNIIGCDWMNALYLNTRTLYNIASNVSIVKINLVTKHLDELFIQYNDVFKNGLAPIVVIPKPSGKIRICADLSTGVNQALDINQYPLLKPNALSVALNGRNQFTKVDFLEAYLQIELDQDCKELLIINTHKGLFDITGYHLGLHLHQTFFNKSGMRYIAAVIYCRYPDGIEKAIAHVSKTYTSTEVNYGQIEKEVLAFIFGIQKFDQFLHRRHFILLTDHKPLLTIFDSKKGNPSALASRLQNWALRLMGYT